MARAFSSYASLCGFFTRLFFFLIAIVLASRVAHAQHGLFGLPGEEYGVFGHYDVARHKADFGKLPGIPNCCPRFSDETGWGFDAGFLYGIAFSPVLGAELRAGYAYSRATLEFDERTVGGLNGQVVPVLMRHSLQPEFHSLFLEPLLAVRPIGGLNLLAGITPEYLLSSVFTQREELVEPEGGVFENNSVYRNEHAGTIPDLQRWRISLTGGLAYAFPINTAKTLWLAPEILYTHDLTNVVSGLDWRYHLVRIGVTLRMAPHRVEPEPPPPPPPLARYDLLRWTLPGLSGTVTIGGISKYGEEEPQGRILIKEYIVNQVTPLLNYVFFDEKSAAISERYVLSNPGDPAGKQWVPLPRAGTMTVYHQLLEIVGSRLRANPSAKITLEGCIDGMAAERAVRNLARKRAEAVKDYLVSSWGIEPSRIAIRARGLPRSPSASDRTDGNEENRRVEIFSSHPDILAPVTTRSVEKEVSPPMIRLYPRAMAESGLQEWNLSLVRGDTTVAAFGSKDSLPAAIDWPLPDDTSFTAVNAPPMELRLHLKDSLNQEYTSPENILPFEWELYGRTVNRYSLILFGFDVSEISASNQAMLEGIRSAIAENSTIIIEGYTDRMGEEKYNETLSLERARRAAKALMREDARVVGLGESRLLYDNNQPEGRFYSRTVNVIIETPVE